MVGDHRENPITTKNSVAFCFFDSFPFFWSLLLYISIYKYILENGPFVSVVENYSTLTRDSSFLCQAPLILLDTWSSMKFIYTYFRASRVDDGHGGGDFINFPPCHVKIFSIGRWETRDCQRTKGSFDSKSFVSY